MDIGSDDPVPNLKSGNSALSGRRRAPFRGVPAAEEAAYGKASQTFHLLVDGSQQVREDYIQFVACGVGRLIAKVTDSVIETARRHWRRSASRSAPMVIDFPEEYDTEHTVGSL